MKTLILSSGHYPAKSGASWGDLKEHDVAVDWVNAIADYLTLNGVKVVVINPTTLVNKVREVNRWAVLEDCIAVELHFNSAGDQYVMGNETLYHPGSEAGKQIAEIYNQSFIELALPWVGLDRGVKEGWYKMDRPGIIDFYGDEDGDEMPNYWLRSTKCPALILEPCFMCQLEDIDNEWHEVCEMIATSLVKIL